MKHTKLLLIAMSSVFALNAAADDGSNSDNSDRKKMIGGMGAIAGVGATAYLTHQVLSAKKNSSDLPQVQFKESSVAKLTRFDVENRIAGMGIEIFSPTNRLANRIDEITGLDHIRSGDLVEIRVFLNHTDSLEIITKKFQEFIKMREEEIVRISRKSPNLTTGEALTLRGLKETVRIDREGLNKILSGESEIGPVAIPEVIKVESPSAFRQSIEDALGAGHRIGSIVVHSGSQAQVAQTYLKKLGRKPRLLGRGLVAGGVAATAGLLAEGASSQAEARENADDRINDMTVEPGKESRGQR